MGRTLKFRAWHKPTDSIREVLVIDWINDYVDLEGGEIEQYFEDVELVQYTGLKDKNGIEIYEGDIVNYEGKNYQILFEEGRFIADEYYNPSQDEPSDFFSEYAYGISEVVGNVYEDSHLLEEST